MAVPDFQTLMLPLLKLAGDGQQHTYAEAVERLAQEFQLSDDDRAQLLKSGQTRLYNRVGWTTTYLKKAGLLQSVGLGRFELTDRGRDVLASRPATIDVAFLESRFHEMSDFRKARSRRETADEEPPATFNVADSTWNQRPGASKNAIVNAYAFYIRGRKAGVPKSKLDEVIARWVFGSLLTARYSGSSETIFEQDLGRLARLEGADADGFVRALDDAMGEIITGDYWTHTLVSALETQKARAPAALAFRAAQIVLGTRALFSDQLLHNLLDPPADGGRAASEAHHLFPTTWLHARGIRERRFVNQVANLADVGWHENTVIGGRGPTEYVPRLRENLGIDDDRWGRLCAEHALPLAWESMDYEEFLRERRRRMADIIRVAFRQLGGEPDAPPLTPPWFLTGAEVVWQRIVDTERALRSVVRETYAARFKETAAQKIQEALPERERETLARALRARPAGSEPLSIVDYLYLGQLPALLFAVDAWQEARRRFVEAPDVKQRLQSALSQIAPVRNEIAHIREVGRDRLLRATVACADVLEMVQNRT